MRGAVLYGPRDVRFEERDAPKILKPTDAIIRLSATCVCGSDLWPYRGVNPTARPTPMGHEYCGIVEDVGGAVRGIKPGQFVIGSFFASDNTCPICRAGYQSSCQHAELIGGAQAPLLRLPLADGTLVGTRDVGATDIVAERGDEGVERIKDMTKGIGADAVMECVGTQQSMLQAIRSTRRGGYISYVGVPHGVQLDGEQMFFSHVHLHGGPA